MPDRAFVIWQQGGGLVAPAEVASFRRPFGPLSVLKLTQRPLISMSMPTGDE
jgi:hypothetical protein